MEAKHRCNYEETGYSIVFVTKTCAEIAANVLHLNGENELDLSLRAVCWSCYINSEDRNTSEIFTWKVNGDAGRE